MKAEWIYFYLIFGYVSSLTLIPFIVHVIPDPDPNSEPPRWFVYIIDFLTPNKTDKK